MDGGCEPVNEADVFDVVVLSGRGPNYPIVRMEDEGLCCVFQRNALLRIMLNWYIAVAHLIGKLLGMREGRYFLTSHNPVYLRLTAVVAEGGVHEQEHTSGSTAGRGKLSHHAASQYLTWFGEYLLDVQGLTPGTRRDYCAVVSRFLDEFCGRAAPDWSSLRVEHLTSFVHREALRLKRHARGTPTVAIRALLRYLKLIGAVRAGMEAAGPRTPRWKHGELPPSLSAEEVGMSFLASQLTLGLDYVIVRFYCYWPAWVCAPSKFLS
jgi:hypothetical protein